MKKLPPMSSRSSNYKATNARPILKYTLEGKYLGRYKSVKSAAESVSGYGGSLRYYITRDLPYKGFI